MSDRNSDFYIIAEEVGAENPAIPTWASDSGNPAILATDSESSVTRREISTVPGCFQLLNVLSPVECKSLVNLTESLGYLEDAAVSLPRSIRHNHNITWIADDATNEIVWQRCKPLMSDPNQIFAGKKALGLNSRFRFYRYQPGDYFSPHSDGAWPGTRVVDGQLVHDAYGDRLSQLSFLLFLSDDYVGGATQFYVNKDDPAKPARTNEEVSVVNIRTPLGGALCFPHGTHPLHCLHSSETIVTGSKYIIRSDVLFER